MGHIFLWVMFFPGFKDAFSRPGRCHGEAVVIGVMEGRIEHALRARARKEAAYRFRHGVSSLSGGIVSDHVLCMCCGSAH